MGIIMAVDPGTTTGVAITNVTQLGTKFETMNKGLGLVRDVSRGTKGRRGGPLGMDFGEVAVATELLPGSFVGWFQIGPAYGNDHEYWVASLICDLVEYCGVNIAAFEDFILRIGSGSSGRDGLSPVRINSCTMTLMRERRITPFLGARGGVATKEKQRTYDHGAGMAMRIGSRTGCQVVWQSPSNAKGVFTDERIRRAGLWVPGRPHAVDAIRHLCLLWRQCEVKGGHVVLQGSSHRRGDQPISDVSV